MTSKRGETIQDHLLFEGEALLDSSKLTAINVGSVGQPRDKDPRAAYGLYDTEQNSFTLRRVGLRH